MPTVPHRRRRPQAARADVRECVPPSHGFARVEASCVDKPLHNPAISGHIHPQRHEISTCAPRDGPGFRRMEEPDSVEGMSTESYSLEALTDLKRRRFEACDALQRRTKHPLVFARSDALELLAVEKPIEPERERRRTDMDVVVGSTAEKSHIANVRFLTWNGPLQTTEVGRTVTCLNPVSAWAHYAAILTLGELVVLGDSMMRRNGRLTRAEIESFHTYLDVANRFIGIENCRLALRLMREGTDSSQETRTRLVPLLYGLPEPTVNHPVRLQSGTLIFLDLSYPQLRIAIEYDGNYHRFDRMQVLRDDKRREALEDMGWIYIKVTVLDLKSESGQEELAQRIATRIEQVIGVPVPLTSRMTVRQVCDLRRLRKRPIWERIPRESWIAPWAVQHS